jgi:hypothetical protein
MVKPCPKELKCDVEVGIYSVFQFSFEEHNNVPLHFFNGGTLFFFFFFFFF